MNNQPFIKCPECGAKIPSGQKICSNCGYIVEKAEDNKNSKKKNHHKKLNKTNNIIKADDVAFYKIMFGWFCLVITGITFGIYFSDKNSHLIVFTIGVVCATLFLSLITREILRKIIKQIK